MNLKQVNFTRIIPLTFIINFPVLTEPQLIAGFIAEGKAQNVWFLWSSVFCLSAGIFFFSNLWKRAGISSENELHRVRYAGVWAKRLQNFRAIFLALIILPLVNAQLIRVFSKTIHGLFPECGYICVVLLIALTAIVFHFKNTLRKRVMQDALIGVSFLVALFWILITSMTYFIEIDFSYFILNSAGIPEIMPSNGIELMEFLFFILFSWWFTGICDFPDMTGQKILSNQLVSPLRQLLTFVFVFAFIESVMLMAGITGGMKYGKEGYSGEEIIAAMLGDFGPNIQVPVACILSLSFYGLLMNNLLWSDKLIGTIDLGKRALSNDKSRFFNMKEKIITISGVGISVILVLNSVTLFGLIKYLLVLGAGVGPVFMLRWYLPQINAQTQLTAMIAALVYSNLYTVFLRNMKIFKDVYNLLFLELREGEFIMQVLFTGVLTTLSWLIVMKLSRNTDEFNHAKEFINKINTSKQLHFNQFMGFILLSVFLLTLKLIVWYGLTLQFNSALISTAVSLTVGFLLFENIKSLNKS